MKRSFDILVAAVALLFLFPFLLLLGLMIWWKDGLPIFFAQVRIGRHGREFRLLKFRTMHRDAEYMGKLSVGERDPRVTDIGHWLRRRKLDELPQLWNVLKGEMSIIGPRPEVPEYVAYYSQEQLKVLEVRPGLSDPASLAYFEESRILAEAENPKQAYIDEVMPAKLEMNLGYIDQANLATDLSIIWRTLRRMMRSI